MRWRHVVLGVLGVGGLATLPGCSKPSAPAGGERAAVAPAATGSAPAAPGPAVPATPSAATFGGRFDGDIAGTAATWTAQQQGERLTGAIDAAGYAYALEGQVRGARATGTLKDPQTGGTMTFEAALAGDELRIALALADGSSTQLRFRRAGASARDVAVNPGGAVPAPAAAQLDPRLVGSWHYTEQLGEPSSGTMLIRWFLDVRADGTYTYGSDSSQQRGRWRTQGTIIQVDDGSGWAPYARYVAQGGQLMFTFDNGKRQLWNRR